MDDWGSMDAAEQDQEEQGFTLIELLIAIVVVGILTAVAIVGIAGLTSKGSSSACAATADAAKAASAVFYANSPTSQYPTDFAGMTTPGSGPALFELPASGVTPNPPGAGVTVLTGKGWTLTLSGGGANEAVFTCT